jgi:predicted O-methyltransferase YrrM
MYNIIKDFHKMNTIEENIILVDSTKTDNTKTDNTKTDNTKTDNTKTETEIDNTKTEIKIDNTKIVTSEYNYIFTVDWFSSNIPIWSHYLKELKDKPNLHFLEIGSFQGRSTVWLLENILTNNTSTITCIDTFEGSIEHAIDFKNDIKNLFDIFSHNISKFKNKVNIIKNKSQVALKQINEQYDFIYIDGDHKASSVIEDAILSFNLLKKGGIIIFDDYLWFGMKKFIDNPKPAIDAFLEIYADKINVMYKNYQVIIEKI